MGFRPPVFRATIATAIAALTISTLVPAANATEGDIPAIVEVAERALGIDDDVVDDEASILSAGEQATFKGTAQDLEITVGDELDESSNVTYTADTLDKSSMRFAAVHESDETNTASWDFGENSELSLLNDGRVSISDEAGDLLAGIEAPWAIDANGKKLETYYSVDGSKLVQTVVFAHNTAFPVVADPKLVRKLFYTTVTFNKSESFTIVGTVASCTALLSKATHPYLKAASIACGVAAAFSGAQLAGGKCIRLHFAGSPPLWTYWPTFPKC